MPHQYALEHMVPAGHGGWRPGAGRKKVYKSRMAHRSRKAFESRCPVLVTLKVRKDVPRLRTARFVRSFRRSLTKCCVRSGFRVVHYSIQTDHVHLMVEAEDRLALANGMKSVGARLARCVNRMFDRSGPVLVERFHHAAKATPQEVRRALAYVLLNARKHFRKRSGKVPPVVVLDEASSGRWFDGWRMKPPRGDPRIRGYGTREVASPRTWLLRAGWKSASGSIDPAEVPGYQLPPYVDSAEVYEYESGCGRSIGRGAF